MRIEIYLLRYINKIYCKSLTKLPLALANGKKERQWNLFVITYQIAVGFSQRKNGTAMRYPFQNEMDY